MIGIDSPTDLMLLLRIDLEMNVWVVPFCGFGIHTTNIKRGSLTNVEIKALGISGPSDFHRGTWRTSMLVSSLNLNIQTFMSVGYHIFEKVYRMGCHPKSSILAYMMDFLRSSYVCLDSFLDITRTTKSRSVL